MDKEKKKSYIIPFNPLDVWYPRILVAAVIMITLLATLFFDGKGAFLETLIGVPLGFGILYVVCQFHWLRILSIGILLLAWGAGAVIAPLYFVFKNFSEGHPIFALILFVCASFPAILFLVGCQSAYKWVKREIKEGQFFRRWNDNEFNKSRKRD